MQGKRNGLVTLALTFGGLLHVSADEVDRLERDLTDAWAAGRPAGVLEARAEVEAYLLREPGSAHAHYLLGLAELIGVLRTNGAPDNEDPDRTVAVLRRARESLARAHELDSSHADACAAASLSHVLPFMLGKGTAEDGPAIGEWMEKGREADPQRASVRLVSLWVTSGQAMGSDAEIDRAMDEFAALGETLRDEAFAKEGGPDFWDLFAQGLAARALIFSPRPRPRMAAHLVDALLEQRPDLHMAKAFLLPFVTPREPLDAGSWSELSWTELGEEAEPDGRGPGLADMTGLAYSLAEDGDALWIRAELAGPPNERLFGVNVILDVDGSQGTGAPWWGSNTDFVFDRLVSAWVARDDEGTYRGAVGVTDHAGAFEGEMTNLPGEVGFGVDTEGEALVLRLPWGELGGADVRFVVAVGSNALWNDDLPDEGSLRLPGSN